MGLLYQKRRLKVNRVKRTIASNRTLIMRLRILFSLLLIAGFIYLGIYILRLPQWRLDMNKLNAANSSVLKIQGNIITPNHKIINMIRQTQLEDTQIFRLNTKELEKNISQLQPVKKVYVRRYWFPARLVVALEERNIAFLLAPNLESEPNSALSTDGVLIDHDYLPLNPIFKPIKLLTYGIRDGRDEIWDEKKVDEILKLVRAIETYSNQQVQYVDIRKQNDIYIMLQEYLIRFGEINNSYLTRAKWIASILPEAKKIEQKIKYIDLRWEDSQYISLEGPKQIVKKAENKKEKPEKDIKEEDNKKEKQELSEDKPKENIPEEILD